MPSSPMVSEREARKREQSAARVGYMAGFEQGFLAVTSRSVALDHARRFAAECYPLPSITKPRERTDSRGVMWKVEDGVVHFRWPGPLAPDGEWIPISANAASPSITPERLSILDDLRANPVETVMLRHLSRASATSSEPSNG